MGSGVGGVSGAGGIASGFVRAWEGMSPTKCVALGVFAVMGAVALGVGWKHHTWRRKVAECGPTLDAGRLEGVLAEVKRMGEGETRDYVFGEGKSPADQLIKSVLGMPEGWSCDWRAPEIQGRLAAAVEKGEETKLIAAVFAEGKYCNLSYDELGGDLGSRKGSVKAFPLNFGTYLRCRGFLLQGGSLDCKKSLREADPELAGWVTDDPTNYDFQGSQEAEKFLNSSLGQLAALGVRYGIFHLLMRNGEIIDRALFKQRGKMVGGEDAIGLILASGTAGYSRKEKPTLSNDEIMTEAFRQIFDTEEGILILSQIGLDREGATAEDVRVHWEAFFAALQSDAADCLEYIYVDSQRIEPSEALGDSRAKFREILEREKNKRWPHPNLDKIRELPKDCRDVDFAHQLKLSFKDVPVVVVRSVHPAQILGRCLGRGGIEEISTWCLGAEEPGEWVGEELNRELDELL